MIIGLVWVDTIIDSTTPLSQRPGIGEKALLQLITPSFRPMGRNDPPPPVPLGHSHAVDWKEDSKIL